MNNPNNLQKQALFIFKLAERKNETRDLARGEKETDRERERESVCVCACVCV